MAWHYMDGDEEIGPISKEELQKLAKEKQVTGATLVRGPGMDDFKALGEIIRRKPAAPQTPPTAPPAQQAPEAAPPAAPPAAAPAQQAPPDKFMQTLVCSECGRSFPEDDMIRFDNANICATCKPAFVQKIKEGAPISGQLQYAGFWIRVGAELIDGTILGIANVIFGVILGLFMVSGEGDMEAASMGMAVVLQLIAFVVPFAYGTWFVGKYAATPGKMACGLRVVKSDGKKVSYALALGRQAAKLISAMILCIGYIMVAFTDEKKGLHDIICDTRVVKK